VRSSDLDQMRALPLFGQMTEASLQLLMKAAFLQRFPPDLVLIREGELPDFLHVVIDGAVELFATHQDRETAIDTLRPFATFILAAVIGDEVYLKSARTLAPSRVLMIPAEAVRDVFDRDAKFARGVVVELAARYRGIVRALKNQKLRTGAERLANWILEAERQSGGHGHVVLAHDKRTLASLLGMTPENLSRSLMTLAEHGVSSRGRRIVVADKAALERWAKPNVLIDG
jgi:CRP/FNR family transcriptional regulator, transcriptional activator FtrB